MDLNGFESQQCTRSKSEFDFSLPENCGFKGKSIAQ